MDQSGLEYQASLFLSDTNFMNTYLFAKSCAERYLARYRGNLRLVISRPSITTGAFREPLIGWSDVVSAAGAGVFPGMIGL